MAGVPQSYGLLVKKHISSLGDEVTFDFRISLLVRDRPNHILDVCEMKVRGGEGAGGAGIFDEGNIRYLLFLR